MLVHSLGICLQDRPDFPSRVGCRPGIGAHSTRGRMNYRRRDHSPRLYQDHLRSAPLIDNILGDIHHDIQPGLRHHHYNSMRRHSSNGAEDPLVSSSTGNESSVVSNWLFQSSRWSLVIGSAIVSSASTPKTLLSPSTFVTQYLPTNGYYTTRDHCIWSFDSKSNRLVVK